MTSPLEQADIPDAKPVQPQADNLSFHAILSSQDRSKVVQMAESRPSPASTNALDQNRTDIGPGTAANLQSSADAKSWTYLVNLTATMLPFDGGGSAYKYERLKHLQDLTIGSNSRVIVQEYEDKTGLLRRYEIANGQINESEPTPSAGTAKDLQNLVALAPEQGHIGLINEAHGNGSLGFHGDAGKLSIDQFEDAVKRGLAAKGRSSLDMLSMDSCLMGNVQVLSKLSGLSKQVVASELEEFSSVEMSATPPLTIYDMQPQYAYLQALLKHPPADGAEAARTIFEVSSKNCDSDAPSHQACGTPTLAIYDSQAAPAAERALDEFGSKLQEVITNPSAKSAVDGLIGEFSDISQAGNHLRDVDSFAQGTLRLIDSGKLSDPDLGLRTAAQNVIAADKALVKNTYLNTNSRWAQALGPQNLRGLNVFLPGANFDVRKEAENFFSVPEVKNLPLNRLLDLEIAASLPDNTNGGWANFVRALRTPDTDIAYKSPTD